MKQEAVVVSQEALQEAIANFKNKYFFYDGKNHREFSSEISVSYKWLETKVQAYITKEGVSEDLVALRFYHRFDLATKSWFLTLVCCQLVAIGENSYSIYPNPDYTYDILEKKMLSDISSDITTTSRDSYFKDIAYTEDKEVYQSLDTKLHVNSVSFPWLAEIDALCRHNGLKNSDVAKIVFVSGSNLTDITSENLKANVAYPHQIYMYMMDGDKPCLGDNDATLGFLHNMAANSGSACPPNCASIS